MNYPLSDIIKIEESTGDIGLHYLSSPTDFFLLSPDVVIDFNSIPANCKCTSIFTSSKADKQEYITNKALQLFNAHYHQNEPASPVCYAGSSELREEFRLDIPAVNNITKKTILHYVYALLHYPAYRSSYTLHSKQLPPLPLYHHFWRWVSWGKQLMDLHVNYKKVAPYPLERKDKEGGTKPGIIHMLLQADKAKGEIEIDAYTSLSGIPKEAWEYRFCGKSFLEWVLDGYKEEKPQHLIESETSLASPFASDKKEVIETLKKVCRVSVETVQIAKEMEHQEI